MERAKLLRILSHVFLVLLVRAEDFFINNYTSGAGVIFENIGKANIYLQDLNFILHYDLTFYSDRYKEVMLAIRNVSIHCKSCRLVARGECRNFMYVLDDATDTLEHQNELINDITSFRRDHVRQKRMIDPLGPAVEIAKGIGAVQSAVVGGVFNMINSALDSEPLDQEVAKFHHQLSEIKNMIKQQIRSFEDLRSNTLVLLEKLAKHLEAVNFTASNLTHHHKIEGQKIELGDLMQFATSLLEIFSMEQSDLLDCVFLARQGSLHPMIFSPKKLKSKLLEMKRRAGKDPHMAAALQVAADNADNMFIMLKTVIYTENRKIVYDLTLPLIREAAYAVHKVTSAPVLVSDDVYAFIFPSQPYLFVDVNENHFFLSKREFDQCQVSDHMQFTCKRLKPLRAKNLTCEYGLLMKNVIDKDNCDIRMVRANRTLFIELEGDGNWIYLAPKPVLVRIYCDEELTQNVLFGTGIINVNSTCKHTETDDVILRDYSTNNLNISYKYDVYHPNSSLRENLERVDANHCSILADLVVLPRTETAKMAEVGMSLPQVRSQSLPMEERGEEKEEEPKEVIDPHEIILYIVCGIIALLWGDVIYLFVFLMILRKRIISLNQEVGSH